MPYRMRKGLHPINSVKHIVDVQAEILAGVQDGVTLALAVDNPVITDTSQVAKGAVINSIYLNVQVRGTAATGVLANAYIYLFKNPGGLVSTVPDANALGISEEKRLVFHQEMRMMSDENDSIPVTIFQGVIRIPKVFRTMRAGDIISLFVFSPSGAQYCVQCIYKEYR